MRGGIPQDLLKRFDMKTDKEGENE
jgi:hypothetical protein